MNITLTPEASVTIQDMMNHCNRIGSALGFDSKFAKDAFHSLAQVQNQILNLGGDVWKDGKLSLCGKTEYDMVYGVIFSRTHESKFKEEIFVDDLADLVSVLDSADSYPGTWSVHT